MLQKSLDLIPITRADQGTTTQNSLFPPSSYTHTSFPTQEVENRVLARPITQGHPEDQPHLRLVRGEVLLRNGPGGTLNKHECSRREWLFLPPVHQPPQRCQSAESQPDIDITIQLMFGKSDICKRCLLCSCANAAARNHGRRGVRSPGHIPAIQL